MKKGDTKKSSKTTRSKKAEKSESVKSDSSRPLGVKIIAIAEYVFAGIFALALIISFLDPSSLNEFLLDAGITIVVARIYFLVLVAVFIVLAFYLWKMKNWVRIAHIVAYGIFFIQGLLSIISGFFLSIIEVFVEGLVVWYLLFNKPVVKMFRG